MNRSSRTASLLVLAIAAAAFAPACESTSSPSTRRAGADPAGGDGGAPGTTAPAAHADVNHVLGTGQSLSIGVMGSPSLSTEQPFRNVMFDTGLEPQPVPPTSFVPLVEHETYQGSTVETPSSSMANLVAKISRERSFGGRPPEPHDLLVSLHGVSGAPYPMICKGTEPYANGIAQVRQAKAIAEAHGQSYVVRAITAVHGETDGWQNGNPDYDKDLVAWQADYENDIRAITGQSEPVPMFHSQYSAWTSMESTPSDIIPFLQLAAHVEAPGKVVLVGPKYFLPYADGLHLTNEGYRWLGEYYAKAYVRQVLEGVPWEPLRPKTIEKDGARLVVHFFVPAPPLVIDTDLVSDPGSNGFSMSDGTAITQVAVTAPDTVTIDLAAAPAAGAHLRYAYAGTVGSNGGPISGPRGNLRDSDATQSRYGYSLFNWCVHFDEPIP